MLDQVVSKYLLKNWCSFGEANCPWWSTYAHSNGCLKRDSKGPWVTEHEGDCSGGNETGGKVPNPLQYIFIHRRTIDKEERTQTQWETQHRVPWLRKQWQSLWSVTQLPQDSRNNDRACGVQYTTPQDSAGALARCSDTAQATTTEAHSFSARQSSPCFQHCTLLKNYESHSTTDVPWVQQHAQICAEWWLGAQSLTWQSASLTGQWCGDTCGSATSATQPIQLPTHSNHSPPPTAQIGPKLGRNIKH